MSKQTATPPEKQQNTTIRLGDVVNKYLEAFQRAFDHLCFALPGFRTMSEQQYDEFARSVGVMPMGPQRMSFDKAKEGTEKYFLNNSLRDLISLVVLFLEDSRTISALIEYKASGKNSDAEVQRIMREDRVQFLNLSLHDKLKSLKEKYELTSELENNVLDLLAVVNCLSQRQGVVGEQDLNRNDKMCVKIRTLRMIQQPLQAASSPGTMPNMQISTQMADSEKTFAVGEKIEFSKQEHISTIISMSIFVTTFAQSIQTFAKKKGVAE
ncbi:MAG: hypothetical protein SGI71_13125 [Verrucomicrobiota bacterium]|nr:hypothetical protein [Verrucomicrobiota bacterium]